MNNLTQRILTGSVFLIVMIGSMLWSIYSVYAVFFTVMLLCTHEYIQLANKIVDSKINSRLLYGLNIYLFLSLAVISKLNDNQIFNFDMGWFLTRCLVYILQIKIYLVLLVPVIVFVVEMFRKTTKPFQTITFTIIGVFYITIPFVLVCQIGELSFTTNLYIIIAYFLCIWINDSFAYVWGKLLGKHKLAPHISAGKTIEGTIGGVVTTVVLSFIFPFFLDGFKVNWYWNIFAFLIAVFSTFSDLSESLLKREAGVKDSGNLLPGHGGFLDRFDSVLLTAPVVYIYLNLVN